jgi:hypothetical protein
MRVCEPHWKRHEGWFRFHAKGTFNERVAKVVHLRAMRYGGQPSRGLPTEAYVYGKRGSEGWWTRFAPFEPIDQLVAATARRHASRIKFKSRLLSPL